MGGYAFSAANLVPRAPRDEPVDIGVLPCDSSKGLLRRRLAGDWDEARRRAGAEPLPDLGAVSGEAPVGAADQLAAAGGSLWEA